ncbi:hypothetical protein C8Q80DRAFT_605265 [Daedaleopsis nitida]|nr:hypothetical protein C8Q80DRAFT_605265 [Daedaleopsis nitida]
MAIAVLIIPACAPREALKPCSPATASDSDHDVVQFARASLRSCTALTNFQQAGLLPKPLNALNANAKAVLVAAAKPNRQLPVRSTVSTHAYVYLRHGLPPPEVKACAQDVVVYRHQHRFQLPVRPSEHVTRPAHAPASKLPSCNSCNVQRATCNVQRSLGARPTPCRRQEPSVSIEIADRGRWTQRNATQRTGEARRKSGVPNLALVRACTRPEARVAKSESQVAGRRSHSSAPTFISVPASLRPRVPASPRPRTHSAPVSVSVSVFPSRCPSPSPRHGHGLPAIPASHDRTQNRGGLTDSRTRAEGVRSREVTSAVPTSKLKFKLKLATSIVHRPPSTVHRPPSTVHRPSPTVDRRYALPCHYHALHNPSCPYTSRFTLHASHRPWPLPRPRRQLSSKATASRTTVASRYVVRYTT